jgi:hypothetical protein
MHTEARARVCVDVTACAGARDTHLPRTHTDVPLLPHPPPHPSCANSPPAAAVRVARYAHRNRATSLCAAARAHTCTRSAHPHIHPHTRSAHTRARTISTPTHKPTQDQHTHTHTHTISTPTHTPTHTISTHAHAHDQHTHTHTHSRSAHTATACVIICVHIGCICAAYVLLSGRRALKQDQTWPCMAWLRACVRSVVEWLTRAPSLRGLEDCARAA